MFLTFFPPPLPKTIASDDRRSRCSAFVCAEEHERFCHPPAPAQVLKRSEGEKLRGRLQFASGHLYSDGVPGIGCILCQST